MNYSECEKYINKIPKFSSNLIKTKEMLDKLKSGKRLPKIIHVAGTNGKGSVCTYIENILYKAGFSVGKFVSPHLVTMRERINLNKEMISEENFANYFQKVKHESEKLGYEPNYFEYTLLIAMAFYLDKMPDYIILETGLGGKLDQTNFVTDEKVAVITEIGMDHMTYLGDTYEKIAGEKAGIIKDNNHVIFYDKRKECTSVIENEIKNRNAISHKVTPSMTTNIEYNYKNGEISFNYDNNKFTIKTLASYQVENASLAIETVLSLDESRIDEGVINGALYNMTWPGRMELLNSGVYIDGAHNVDGIEAFISSVKNAFSSKECYLVFGVVADKEYEKMVKILVESNCFKEIIVTILDTDRSTNIEQLQMAFKQFPKQQVSFTNNVSQAMEMLLSKKKSDDQVLFSVGSLYLVGQIKENYK